MANTDTLRAFNARNTEVREVWLRELSDMITRTTGDDEDPAVREIVEDRVVALIIDEGPTLGRSSRWQNAVCFAVEHSDDGADNHWLALQSIVFLNYANI